MDHRSVAEKVKLDDAGPARLNRDMRAIDPTYWIASPGAEAAGPYTFEQISSMWKSGMFTADSLVMSAQGGGWTPLARAMAAADLARAQTVSSLVYRLLALFLGGLGIHNFMAGETFSGWIKLGLLISAAVFSLGGESFIGVACLAAVISLILSLSDLVWGPVATRRR